MNRHAMISCLAALLVPAMLAACGGSDDGEHGGSPVPIDVVCRTGELPDGAASASFDVAGWSDRGYDLQLPSTHRCGQPIAVAIVFHGGGGNKSLGKKTTCPDGDTTSDACLDQMALAAGMAVVFPNGTNVSGSGILSPGGIRTWNAGGGTNGYNCVSGNACASHVDDVAYVRSLIASLGTRLTVDPKRVFATGFSNGAALSHRLACQASDLFAAVATVSGENQFALVEGGCAPTQRVAVLDIHGTADGCWPYDGGPGGCIENGLYVSVGATLSHWATRNACVPSTATALSSIAPADGTSVVRFSYAGCAPGGELQHLQIVGGGHFWPRGSSSSLSDSGGVQSRQLDANRALIDWFKSHGRA